MNQSFSGGGVGVGVLGKSGNADDCRAVNFELLHNCMVSVGSLLFIAQSNASAELVVCVMVVHGPMVVVGSWLMVGLRCWIRLDLGLEDVGLSVVMDSIVHQSVRRLGFRTMNFASVMVNG